MRQRFFLVCALSLSAWAPAAAQTDRAGTRGAALDTVVAVADYFADAGMWQTQLVFDTFGTVEVAPAVQASVRPLFWRMKDGTWKVFTPHASLRYSFKKGSNWRVELGRFPSPVGLGMTENRPNLNPAVLWCHRPYYGDVPSLGAGTAPHTLISANYPIGGLVSTSGDRWDARAALTDRAPVDVWTTPAGTPHRVNAVIGAGLTPRQGVRVGVATAWGRSGDHRSSQAYRLVNLEGEYAFAYTRITGEWTRDEFDTPGGSQVARGWTLQARQTLTPRIFAHSRLSTVAAPAAVADGVFEARRFLSIDTTVGYLVSSDVAIRAGHAAIKGWTSRDSDHQIGVSLVWSKRWW